MCPSVITAQMVSNEKIVVLQRQSYLGRWLTYFDNENESPTVWDRYGNEINREVIIVNTETKRVDETEDSPTLEACADSSDPKECTPLERWIQKVHKLVSKKLNILRTRDFSTSCK